MIIIFLQTNENHCFLEDHCLLQVGFMHDLMFLWARVNYKSTMCMLSMIKLNGTSSFLKFQFS
jgi:hypothetical protein